MFGTAFLCVTLWAFSIVLGSLGIFFVYLSFLKPDAGSEAIILLGAALMIVLAMTPDENRSSRGKTRRP